MVYLLRFHEPVGSGKKFVRYYMGYCDEERLDERMKDHRSGRGAKLTAAAAERGIDFDVIRTWKGLTRADERRLKNQKNHSRFDNRRNGGA